MVLLCVAMCLYGVDCVAIPYTMVLHCVAMYLYGVVLCSTKNVAEKLLVT